MAFCTIVCVNDVSCASDRHRDQTWNSRERSFILCLGRHSWCAWTSEVKEHPSTRGQCLRRVSVSPPCVNQGQRVSLGDLPCMPQGEIKIYLCSIGARWREQQSLKPSFDSSIDGLAPEKGDGTFEVC